MVLIEDFHKAYGKTVAVSGLSFQVAPGQILGLVGPNGAGKTTTLRSVAGIVPPTRGRLAVGGHSVTDEPIQAKRKLGYVPDDPQLFHDLTVQHHLEFTASAYRVDDAASKVDQLLEQFQLTGKRHAAARDLSRGMRQKLAICCAYLHDPTALLFDEPLTGLDPPGIRTLKRSIIERAQLGASIIVSSHLLAMVEDICSHVLILGQGQTQFCGPIEELKSTFGDQQSDATLEEIFFRAIEQAESLVETCVAAHS